MANLAVPDFSGGGEICQVVKWSNILETEGTEAVSLSSDSNTLDFSLTNRNGNDTLKMKDTAEPFEICLGISPPSDDDRGSKLRHVQPSFNGKDEFLVYHQLTIDKSGAAMKVEFIPDEKPLSYVFFYGVGYKPSLLVYDGRVFLKNLKTEGGKYQLLLITFEYSHIDNEINDYRFDNHPVS
ncbi:uncharacterized protein TNCV_1557591 [Trichonephila clavipes]|nr:uncharacterized protein TNCV_1557591 [Trichonephila clavipes]